VISEANHHQRPQLHSLPSEDVPEAIINVKSEMPDSCTLDNMAMVNFFSLFKNLKLASFYAPNKRSWLQLADMDDIGIQYAHSLGKKAILWL
jgi:hypothetical protein